MYEKIDPEFKAKWIAALRSGKYIQGQKYLQADGKFCCLGVACDVIDSNGWKNTAGWTAVIPSETAARLNLEINVQKQLWKLNDHEGRSFLEIADWIEENL